MADKLKIVNQALLLLAEKTIQSLEEDTNEARVAAIMYEDARDACLREIKPNFAIKRSAKLPDAGVPAFQYERSAGLPQDCTLVLAVWQNGYPVTDWVVEGRAVLTDYADVQVRYISLLGDLEARMDSSFVKAFVAYLAAEFTYTLTNASSKLAAMQLLYEARKKDAENQYGQESAGTMVQNDQLTSVR